MKAEPNRLIPLKPIENLELLIGMRGHFFFEETDFTGYSVHSRSVRNKPV